MSHKNKLGTVAFLAATVFLIGGTLVYIIYFGNLIGPTPTPTGTMALDPNVWKDKARRELRWEMVNDVQTHHLVEGTSEATVLELLGRPERTLSRAEVTRPGKEEVLFYYYDLGPEGREFDCSYLVVSFDSSSRIITTSLFSN